MGRRLHFVYMAKNYRLNESACQKRSIKLVGTRYSVVDRANRGSTGGFLLLQRFSVRLAVEYSSCIITVLNPDLYVCCFDASMSYKSFTGTDYLIYL